MGLLRPSRRIGTHTREREIVKQRAFMMKLPGFVEFIFICGCANLLLLCHFKLLHIMGIELAKRGGGKYSVPTIEVIEITTEKGFATSNPDGLVLPMSYDDSYMDESDEA